MLTNKRSEILIFPTLEKASEALAKTIASLFSEIGGSQATFSLALSGGRTPGCLYQILGKRYAEHIDWSAVHLFWSDEREVPFNHQESNFALVEKTLIQHVPFSRSNIHPMPDDIQPLQKAAEAYDRELRIFFRSTRAIDSGKGNDSFDVMILGLGEDGHTASLFPGSEALQEEHLWVKDVQAPESVYPKKRLTLTLPVINRSKHIFFLVAGKNKREIVQKILKADRKNRPAFPAEKIKSRGKLFWYLDREAAGYI